MPKPSKAAWVMLAIILVLPLFSMMVVPYYDTSEPRYAEIARIMLETGDWITLWFSPGVPFWGKPPLSFWAQALSMKVFGLTEFAGRFPSWLCLVVTNALFLAGLRATGGLRLALWACIIYSTSALVYISSGAVLTDPFLALGTTLSLVSFARVVQTAPALSTQAVSGTKPHQAAARRLRIERRLWAYGFFVGLAIGLLSKGPLAAVVIFAPLVVWYMFNRKRRTFGVALPWLTGLMLTALLTLPWYILAEMKTPGFLDYFIVGEHVRRFLDPGWAGDLYGSAHRRAYGTIWLYWLQASFPWALLALAIVVGALRSTALRAALQAVHKMPLFGYWVTGAVFTPIFFTFSANILWTYILPSLAAFSVLLAVLLLEVTARYPLPRARLMSTAALVPTLILAASTAAWISPDLRNTERELVRYVARQSEPAVPLFYLSELPFSARFYSSGQAQNLAEADLPRLLHGRNAFYLAVPNDKLGTVSEVANQRLQTLFSNKRYSLVKIPGTGSEMVAEREAGRG